MADAGAGWRAAGSGRRFRRTVALDPAASRELWLPPRGTRREASTSSPAPPAAVASGAAPQSPSLASRSPPPPEWQPVGNGKRFRRTKQQPADQRSNGTPLRLTSPRKKRITSSPGFSGPTGTPLRRSQAAEGLRRTNPGRRINEEEFKGPPDPRPAPWRPSGTPGVGETVWEAPPANSSKAPRAHVKRLGSSWKHSDASTSGGCAIDAAILQYAVSPLPDFSLHPHIRPGAPDIPTGIGGSVSAAVPSWVLLRHIVVISPFSIRALTVLYSV